MTLLAPLCFFFIFFKKYKIDNKTKPNVFYFIYNFIRGWFFKTIFKVDVLTLRVIIKNKKKKKIENYLAETIAIKKIKLYWLNKVNKENIGAFIKIIMNSFVENKSENYDGK